MKRHTSTTIAVCLFAVAWNTTAGSLMSQSLNLGVGTNNVFFHSGPGFLTGTNNQSFAVNSAAVGLGNIVSNGVECSLLVGEANNGNGHHNLLSGFANNAVWHSNRSILVGTENLLGNGTNSAAFGRQNIVQGDGPTALGMNNQTKGWGSSAIGAYNFVHNWNTAAIALGSYNESYADAAIAAGDHNYVSGRAAVALGEFNDSYGQATIVGGHNLIGNAMAATYLGMFNSQIPGEADAAARTQWRSEDPILVVGKGQSGAPSNALVIKKSGRVDIASTESFINNSRIVTEASLGQRLQASIGFAAAGGSAIGTGSIAIGTQTSTSQAGQIALGRNNAPMAADDLMAIGNSTGATPSNAMTLKRDGTLVVTRIVLTAAQGDIPMGQFN